MIYAIGCQQFVKFGFTAHNSTSRRLLTLQCGNPFELKVLAEAMWPEREEHRVHLYLDGWHVRGEWFELCDRAYKVIDAMQRPNINAWYALLTQSSVPHRLQKIANLMVARA